MGRMNLTVSQVLDPLIPSHAYVLSGRLRIAEGA